MVGEGLAMRCARWWLAGLVVIGTCVPLAGQSPTAPPPISGPGYGGTLSPTGPYKVAPVGKVGKVTGIEKVNKVEVESPFKKPTFLTMLGEQMKSVAGLFYKPKPPAQSPITVPSTSVFDKP